MFVFDVDHQNSSRFLAESTDDLTIQEFWMDLQMIWPFAYSEVSNKRAARLFISIVLI